MRKNSQFDQIYSEQDVDFNNTATKLQVKQQKSSLKSIIKNGNQLSNIAKAYIQEGKPDQIKKRKSESQNQLQSKLSYRERSKQRYAGTVNSGNPNVEQPNSEDHLTLGSSNKEPDVLLNVFESKPSVTQQRHTTSHTNSSQKQKIINQNALPKVTNKSDNLYNIYGVGKKPQPKIKPIDHDKSHFGKDGKDRAARMLKLERAKEILSGKLSVVWIFVISSEIDEQIKDRIYQVYKGLIDDTNIVPFVKNAWEIEPFLNLPNAYFKIVANINNIEDALRYKINIKVVQYYIYNDEGEIGTSKALQYKSWSKKVKGIYTDLQRIVQKTQEEIEDTIQIYKFNNGLEASIKQKKFPSFLKLSGRDKSEATLYRGNLYGSIKLSQQDKRINYEYFLMLVREKYGKIQKQQANIIDYTKIKHLNMIKTLSQAKDIIQFYVRESFYYQVLNSMLRTLKTTEEFKPCILPFHETFHSVKLFYQDFLKEKQRKLPAMTLYRGAKLKKRDFKQLKQGDFIQMFGFMSTSKSKESAEKFTDSDGYLFVINVKERVMIEKYDKYDHGFVDINHYKLAGKEFQGEEEVLFNVLNIYKVSKIQDNGRNILIHLEYGAIFDLLDKPKNTLTSDEKDVLTNYQYCTKLMGQIEDQGDVHLLASQFDEAKDYYLEKIQKNEVDAKNYYKLANVQKQCGQIDEAEKNGKISLQLLTQKMNLNDRQTCIKVFSIHSRNAEINLQKEDYLNADEEITKGIQLLDNSDIFNKAKKIRERGEIKFKKGEIKQAEKDFQTSQKLFNEVEKLGTERRWEVKKRYIFSYLTLWCSQITKQELQSQRQEELTEIQTMQQQIASLKEEIQDELIRVNKSMKDVAIYAEDKERYEYCVKKGRAYLLNLQQRQTNDFNIKARLKVMEATIQDYLTLAESQILIMEAIALIQSQEPFDPDVGQYSTILAKLQKAELQKFTNPNVGVRLNPHSKLQYNEAEHKAIYNRCKNNFLKAIQILLYNNKTKGCSQVVSLKNQLGQLQFTESNFRSCQELIFEIKADASQLQHTELSKTSLLLGKIAFSRGQLKNSFKIMEQADANLQKVLIKSKQNPKYILLYEKSDIYLEIILYRSKIYHRQMHHDLSLKQLSLLQKKLDQKMEGYQSHSLLASVFEEQGEIRASLGQRDFLKSFNKAIELRKKQMGEYNIMNAVSYCNYSKYLLMVNEVKDAQEQLNRAVQIFSCMSNEHPINWIIYFSNGIFSEIKEQYVEADKLFKNSLEMASKKFDSSHITIKKVRLKIAKVLLKLGDIEQSFKSLEQLEEDVEEDLKESRTKIQVLEEIDDEKITLEKIILTELKSVIEKEQNNVRFSQIEIEKYKKKYDDLRRTFKLEGQQKF